MGDLSNLVLDLEKQEKFISEKRKNELASLALIIAKHKNALGKIAVNFICTHNSRRSQLAQVWMHIACLHYEVNNLETCSGGTETTAFNHRMVRAMKQKGFDITTVSEGENPHYEFTYNNEKPLSLFSKVYDDVFNPQKNFIAVMVCSSADIGCPVVFGATDRFTLTYIDPKAHDNTEEEAIAYGSKVEEIGREILYLARLLKA